MTQQQNRPITAGLIMEAAACGHAAKNAVRLATGQQPLPDFKDLDDNARKELIGNAQAVINTFDPKTRQYGIKPEEIHQSWAENRTGDGWKQGNDVDVSNKVHPNLRPFAELPPQEQAKDIAFIKGVQTITDMVL